MLSSDFSCINARRSFWRYLRTTGTEGIRFKGLDKNMLVPYIALKYFNSNRDMDILLAGNKNAVDLNLIYSLFIIAVIILSGFTDIY